MEPPNHLYILRFYSVCAMFKVVIYAISLSFLALATASVLCCFLLR